MPQDLRAIYSIGVVARLVGVTPGTLRTWEDRYGVISPTRSRGGRRLYSQDEVERLRFVKTKIDEGIQPADAHRLLGESAGGVDRSGGTTPAGARPLILLAERDPFAAEFVEYVLREEGYEVDVVFDVADAERKFAGWSPQLAIVELLLSGAGGADLCRRIKARGVAPVLVVSTLAARDVALTAGADAFLQKPLDPVALASTVRDLLRSSTLAEPRMGKRP